MGMTRDHPFATPPKPQHPLRHCGLAAVLATWPYQNLSVNNYLISIYLPGVYFIGVYFLSVYLSDIYLLSVHLLGVYFLNVLLEILEFCR